MGGRGGVISQAAILLLDGGVGGWGGEREGSQGPGKERKVCCLLSTIQTYEKEKEKD